MKEKKQKSESISFEKNVNNNYYTVTAIDNEGNEVKFQALIFNREKVQHDIKNREKAQH